MPTIQGLISTGISMFTIGLIMLILVLIYSTTNHILNFKQSRTTSNGIRAIINFQMKFFTAMTLIGGILAVVLTQISGNGIL